MDNLGVQYRFIVPVCEAITIISIRTVANLNLSIWWMHMVFWSVSLTSRPLPTLEWRSRSGSLRLVPSLEIQVLF
jgi:hypothetical protein